MSSSFDELRAEARFWRALGIAILVHAAVLAIPGRDRIKEQLLAGNNAPPMSVVIVPSPEPPATQPSPPATPPAEPSPEPAPRPERRPRRESIAKAPETAPRAAPVPPPLPAPTPAPRAPEKAPPLDMAAIIAARQAQRRNAEANALAYAKERDRGPQVADSSAAQAIERNLGSLAHGSEGTSGVFQILRKGTRTAEFAFNGWKPDSSRRWREVIEVDAGLGGDVELAIVQRMIKLIREHYNGDFNWESYRIGKVIVLSARPEDNDKLEDFLAREFFGTPLVKRDRAPAPPG